MTLTCANDLGQYISSPGARCACIRRDHALEGTQAVRWWRCFSSLPRTHRDSMGCTFSKRPGGRRTGGGRRPPASSHHLGRSDPSAEGAQHWLKPVQHAASPQPEAQQAETQRPSGGAAAASPRQPGEQPSSSIPPAAAAPQSLTRTCKPCSGPNPSIPADYGIPPDDPCTSPRESARLAALSSLRFVRAPTGPRFAAITALLRSVFEVPIANVYLMEEDSVLQASPPASQPRFLLP